MMMANRQGAKIAKVCMGTEHEAVTLESAVPGGLFSIH